MCGIVGYVGENKATPILLNGLSMLEYRGYDSAGIAILNTHTNNINSESYITIKKEKGRVANLKLLDGIDSLNGSIGIAHTRWATHGKPSTENAHPHMDNSCSFAVVHNGIIENYNVLRDFLISKGYHFFSQTDTEVIPNLIHYYYEKNHDNNCEKNHEKNSQLHFLQSVVSACNDLIGSYAIEVICKKYKDIAIVVRKDSPLVIAKGKHEHYIASDIPAIISYSKNFYLLDDNEFAIISKDEVHFYDSNLLEHDKKITSINLDSTATEKDGFEDYMLKEIFEQPKAIRETIGSRFNENKCSFDELNFSKDYLCSLKNIYIVACGTAMHAGLTGKTLIEKLCRIPVTVDIASEFRYRNPIIDEHSLCIFISQSGETADTIAALKLAKENHAKTLAISNVIGSSITREADYSIYTHAGPEIAVASTKAYTSQVILLSLLGIYFAEVLDDSSTLQLLNSLKQEISELPKKVSEVLTEQNVNLIKEIAKKMYQSKDVFFLGRGTDYNVALEGSLKLKEISYIHSEAYAAGELKHGPIALIENEVPVIGILTDSDLTQKTISNLQEVITRGANTVIVTNETFDDDKKSIFDYIINIPKVNSNISPVLSVIPLQLLSYYISKEKGLDVDKPRNLAKSVTVE